MITRRDLAEIALYALASVPLVIVSDLPETYFHGCFILAAGVLYHYCLNAIVDWRFKDDPESDRIIAELQSLLTKRDEAREAALKSIEEVRAQIETFQKQTDPNQ